MKIGLIVASSLIIVGVLVFYLYQKSKTDQIKAENDKLALIYGGLANTKPQPGFLQSLFGTVFSGASSLLANPGAGQALTAGALALK